MWLKTMSVKTVKSGEPDFCGSSVFSLSFAIPYDESDISKRNSEFTLSFLRNNKCSPL